MKKRQITGNMAKVISTFMFVCILSGGLIGCSDKDVDSPNGAGGGGIPGQLIGTWYGDYASQGKITTAAPGSRTGYYVRAVQGLTFNADGTGTCYQYLCNVAGDPLSIYGGSMDAQNGQFHFTVKDDSIVTITRDGEGDAMHPKTWTLVNGHNGIRGTDGTTEYSMQTATAEEQGYLSDWEKLLRAGSNDDPEEMADFLNNWEKAKTVNLSNYGTRNLPWYGSADNDIPESIRFDMKKADGWQMAFCMLNDKNAPNVHMFGLYNKLTGTLRVWQYVENASAYGKELFFNLVNDSYSPNRYPFYNSMAYCIPLNRTWGEQQASDPLRLKVNAELITNGNHYKPFEYLMSAYTRSGEAKGVSPNWHCVDIDLSAYMPKDLIGESGKRWRESVDAQRSLFNISLASQNVSEVTLSGKLLGDLAGSFTSETTVKSSCANPHLAKATNVIGNIAGLFNTTYTNLNCLCGISKNSKNVFWDPGQNGGGGEGGGEQGGEQGGQPAQIQIHAPRRSLTFMGFMAGITGLLNITSAVLKSIPNPTSVSESAKGNINMSLNANLDLNGLITQWTGLPDGGVTVTPFLLNASNEDSSIGTGCFGLKEDPVIYICKEDLLSSSDRINITKNSDGTMYCDNFDKKEVRMVAFLDPSSVKFYLNTDTYHDITDLTLTAIPIVDLYRPLGNTDTYLDFMKLPERPTITLPKNLNEETSKPRLHVLTPSQVLANDTWTEAFKDSVKLVEQTGGKGYRYYGVSSATWGRNCMVDPQIYIPYQGSQVFDMNVPDYFVNIVVNFKCREAPYGVEICKQYVPKYVLLSRSQLAEKYEELKAYAAKCDKEQSVGAVENAPDISYINYSGGKYLRKTLNILKKIAEDAAENP